MVTEIPTFGAEYRITELEDSFGGLLVQPPAQGGDPTSVLLPYGPHAQHLQGHQGMGRPNGVGPVEAECFLVESIPGDD